MYAWIMFALLVVQSPGESEFREADAIRAGQPVRARTLYERAARAGHPQAQAMLGLLLFQDGRRREALPWLKAAADQGDARGMLVYGTALFNGDGVPVDRVRGYALVLRAALKGLEEAETTASEMELVMSAQEKSSAGRLAGPTAPPAAPASPAAAATATGWQIQLGAFRQPGAAQALFARLGPKLPGKQASYAPLGSLTRLLVGPYDSKAAAQSACRALGPRQGCFAVAPKR